MRGIVVPSLVLSFAVDLTAATAWAESPVGNRPTAEQLIAEVARSSSEPSTKSAARPLDEAARSLRRAKAARDGGDSLHATYFEGLALEWAETARDLVRAAKAEAQAGEVEQRASEASVRSERARSLLEETIARKGEVTAQLERMGKAPPGARPRQARSESSPTSKPSAADVPTGSSAPKPAGTTGKTEAPKPAGTTTGKTEAPKPAGTTTGKTEAPKPAGTTGKTEPAKVQP